MARHEGAIALLQKELRHTGRLGRQAMKTMDETLREMAEAERRHAPMWNLDEARQKWECRLPTERELRRRFRETPNVPPGLLRGE